MMLASGALNLRPGKQAAHGKAEFEIVRPKDRKADDVTASRVVHTVVNWDLEPDDNNVRRASDQTIGTAPRHAVQVDSSDRLSD
jgi:hypothetical protein